jgi:hypothetical protein
MNGTQFFITTQAMIEADWTCSHCGHALRIGEIVTDTNDDQVIHEWCLDQIHEEDDYGD